jgi:hypothetical protein
MQPVVPRYVIGYAYGYPIYNQVPVVLRQSDGSLQMAGEMSACFPYWASVSRNYTKALKVTVNSFYDSWYTVVGGGWQYRTWAGCGTPYTCSPVQVGANIGAGNVIDLGRYPFTPDQGYCGDSWIYLLHQDQYPRPTPPTYLCAYGDDSPGFNSGNLQSNPNFWYGVSVQLFWGTQFTYGNLYDNTNPTARNVRGIKFSGDFLPFSDLFMESSGSPYDVASMSSTITLYQVIPTNGPNQSTIYVSHPYTVLVEAA